MDSFIFELSAELQVELLKKLLEFVELKLSVIAIADEKRKQLRVVKLRSNAVTRSRKDHQISPKEIEMKKTSSSVKVVLMAIMALFLTVAASQVSFAQRPGGGGPPSGAQPDVLAGLKHALEDAGAADLSAQQEEQLKALIAQARNAGGPPQDNDAVMQARKAYETAILAGNTNAANAAAQTIANAISAGMIQGLQSKANFDVQALAILKSNQQQYNALLARFGSKGIFHLVDSLIGGPGGGRPFGAGGPNGQGVPMGGGRPGGMGGGRPGAPTRP